MIRLRQKTGVVLCVDDNDQHLATLVAIVKMDGHKALLAHSYEEAVEVLKNSPEIDVLLTDYKMGTLSGIDLCEYTQKHYPLIRKVIVTSMQSVLDMHNHFKKIDAVVMKVSTAQERINEIIHDKLARDAMRARQKAKETGQEPDSPVQESAEQIAELTPEEPTNQAVDSTPEKPTEQSSG